jgi:thiosulfate/3-mercaptopyruvate sulfurtransferase
VKLAVLACSVVASQAVAQSTRPRDRLLASTDWLAQHLDDPTLVVLHVGARAEYDRGHVPGARYIELDDISAPHVMDGEHLRLEMPAAEQLRATFERLGVSDGSRVVVVIGDRRETPAATRVLLTLDYLGIDSAVLLDGGHAAWKAEGRRVTEAAPPTRSGKLSARPVRDVIVDADFVNRHRSAPGFRIVDARERRFYERTASEGGQRPGHVAGALSLPYRSVLDAEGRFLDDAALQKLFRDAGVLEGQTVVGYCHIGMQATTLLFAARLLGHPVRLYDGSFEDWSRREALPVESSPSRRN